MAIISGTDGNDILNGAEGSTIQRVSTSSGGAQANGGSFEGNFFPDGTKIIFESDASNLVPNDTNGTTDLFVRDVATGTVTLVSTDSAGGLGNGSSSMSGASIFSPDGTKFLFTSNADNLVPGDTNGAQDIFMKNLATGAVTLISADSAGNEGNNISGSAVFSPDGTKVAFSSNASNLVPNDTNNITDVFIRDLATGVTTRISTDASGVQGNGLSHEPAFSPDGTKVAFTSAAGNLGGDVDIGTMLIKDLTTGVVTQVLANSTGATPHDANGRPVFSPDGSKIAFLSGHTDPGDNDVSDIFIKDMITGVVTLVSGNAAGVAGDGNSLQHAFSADGSKIIFASQAANLVPGDNNSTFDIFVKDLATGTVTMVSRNSAGIGGNSASVQPEFSSGGKILFASDATNLVPEEDTNITRDLFQLTQGAGADDTISGHSGNDTIHGGGGNDVMTGGSGNDVLDGGAGDDKINGNSGTDTIRGGTGDDRIFGNDGNDFLFGDEGDDLIDGGKGNDVMDGGAGNDAVTGRSGHDTIRGGTGDDILTGNSGNDIIHGGTDIDTLLGGGDKDALFGDEGDDSLNGGGGIDTLTGGAGADRFIFNGDALFARDRVLDFSLGQGDRLELQNILEGFNPLASSITDFVKISNSEGDSKLFVDMNGTVDGRSFIQIAFLSGVTGLTNEAQLLADGVLVVV